MQGVNDVVSERLKVAPLKEGEIAKYRLKMADKEDITRTEESSGKKLKHQQVYSFVGQKRIWDPYAKKRILIRNITSFKTEKMPDGSLKEIPQVGRVLFPRTGEVILTSRDNDLYAYLERLDENESNEYRDPKGTAARFYRVDVKKQTMKEMEKDYIKLDAMVWVRDANETELKTIYKGLDDGSKTRINADSFEQLKRGIYLLSQENPILVLKASTNKVAKVKVQCMDAERFRIIAFDEGKEGGERRWVFIGENPTTITAIEPGVHKVDGLVKFFTEDKAGRDWYTKIVEALKMALDYKR